MTNTTPARLIDPLDALRTAGHGELADRLADWLRVPARRPTAAERAARDAYYGACVTLNAVPR